MNLESLLVLAAFPPELAGLDRDAPATVQVACTGVGAIAAGVTTMRLIANLKPSRVLFLGTCGAYDERLALGDFISVSTVRATSLDEVEGRAYRPGIERTHWTSDWLPPFPAHSVAVTPGITRSEAGARLLASVAAVEHLELSGVFAACAEAGVPVGAALVIANRVGPDAHREWLEHHARVSAELVDALKVQGLF